LEDEMNKLQKAALLFCMCLIVVLTTFIMVNLAVGDEPDVIQLIVGVPEAVTDKLPTGCVKEVGGECKAWLAWAWMPQVATHDWLLLDLWGRIDVAKGGYFHAFAYRRKVGAIWVWQIHGPRAFYELFKAWKATEPGVLLYQPHDVLTSGGLCNQLAPAWFVDVTADSGIRAPLNPLRTSCAAPTDAGPGDCTVSPRTYPDGSTVNCASKWWLIRSRWGGPPPRPWSPASDAGYGQAVSAVPRGGPAIVVPDARTVKTCYGVPIGTVCP